VPHFSLQLREVGNELSPVRTRSRSLHAGCPILSPDFDEGWECILLRVNSPADSLAHPVPKNATRACPERKSKGWSDRIGYEGKVGASPRRTTTTTTTTTLSSRAQSRDLAFDFEVCRVPHFSPQWREVGNKLSPVRRISRSLHAGCPILSPDFGEGWERILLSFNLPGRLTRPPCRKERDKGGQRHKV
jgi:hypothetical protein